MRLAETLRIAACALLLTASACATAPIEPEPPGPFEAVPAAGVRWGVVVMTLEGEELLAIRPDERFIPASNTKLFTAAAAFHFLDDLDVPDHAAGTSLWLEARGEGEAPDLVLRGAGDASFADHPDCLANCLHHLADAALAAGVRRVSDVIGDDSLLPASLWGQGWSWNNFVWYYTAPVSALSVNENTLGLRVAPGAEAGAPLEAAWLAGDDLLTLDNRAVTGAADAETTLRMDRVPGDDRVRMTGAVPIGTPARTFALAVQNPAETVAARLIRLLRDRDIEVEGVAKARSTRGDGFATQIARMTPPALIESVRRVSRDSQNLHAELLLRRIALARGDVSPEGGAEVLGDLVFDAGLTPVDIELFDGSGLSSYNRVSPRGAARFILWASRQAWGEDWRATLPAGGADGTLARRFRGTILEGRIFAKTGSLHGVNALSGYMLTASGRTLIFSVFANDRPADGPSIIAAMDAELVRIAAEN